MSDFYTQQAYESRQSITPAMEDYVEMMYRIVSEGEAVHVNQLAALLNVRPSSFSKMAHRLKEENLIDFEPYGTVSLTDKGARMGEYLLFRHNTLMRFFCQINHTRDELELVEKIEHFFDERTIKNIERFLQEK